MCDITQQMNDDWEKKNKDLLHIAYMTLGQKAQLRSSMRYLSIARSRMNAFDFGETMKYMNMSMRHLELLAEEVKMNGENNKEESGI